jgi:hypothetical protein
MFTVAEAWLRRHRRSLETALEWWPELAAAACGLIGFVAFYGFANLYVTAGAFLVGLCILTYSAFRQRP